MCATVVPTNTVSVVLVHSEKNDYSESFRSIVKISGKLLRIASSSSTKCSRGDRGWNGLVVVPNLPGGLGHQALCQPPLLLVGRNLPVWTEEELEKESATRGDPSAGMVMWTEAELEEDAKKHGFQTNLEFWTEEELEKEREMATRSTSLSGKKRNYLLAPIVDMRYARGGIPVLYVMLH